MAEATKAPDALEIAKLNRILKVLPNFAKDLNEARSVEDVLQRIMEIVFDHVPADRGFLMLREEGQDASRPWWSSTAPPAATRARSRSRRRSPTAC